MRLQHCVACGWMSPRPGYDLDHDTLRQLLDGIFGKRERCPDCGYMVLIWVEK